MSKKTNKIEQVEDDQNGPQDQILGHIMLDLMVSSIQIQFRLHNGLKMHPHLLVLKIGDRATINGNSYTVSGMYANSIKLHSSEAGSPQKVKELYLKNGWELVQKQG